MGPPVVSWPGFSSSSRRRSAAVILHGRRRRAKQSNEGAAHALRVAEAAGLSNVLHGAAGAGDRAARRLGAQVFDGLGGGHARLGLECAREIARTHACMLREIRNAVPLIQMASYVVEQGCESAVGALHVEQSGELRLTAGAAVV